MIMVKFPFLLSVCDDNDKIWGRDHLEVGSGTGSLRSGITWKWTQGTWLVGFPRSKGGSCIQGQWGAGPRLENKYMVVLHHFLEQIDGLGSGQVFVLGVDQGRQLYSLVRP